MKNVKAADCIIQGLLIITGFVLGFAAGDLNETLFIGYFLVGGWQVLSVIVHFFYKPPYNTRLRKIYLIILGLVLLIVVLSIPMQGIIFVLLGLLFVSPVMAIYYLVTCFKETQALKPIGEDFLVDENK